MGQSRATIAVLIALAMLPGCATKRYGRLQPVTTAEMQVYDCQDIEVEIAKVEAFRGQVSDGARFNGASVMGFLGDWGIGNAQEKNQADRTATERMNDLLALKAQKGCTQRLQRAPEPVKADTTPAPVASPSPAASSPGLKGRVKCITCR